jgi:hypothetical protein
MSRPPDPFELLKSLWGPMGLPMAGMIAPAINADEIERRIAELKSVESWLNMNLNVLRMTLQALEMQKSGIAAIKEAVEKAANTQESGPDGNSSSALAEAWWNVLQQQMPPGRKDPPKE